MRFDYSLIITRLIFPPHEQVGNLPPQNSRRTRKVSRKSTPRKQPIGENVISG
ncbi:spermidine/putrescine ABC transporter ATP-binding protein [Bacillus anthracis]|nr:spermidine/putrescine ABC transporter ATP-binding protein [Bacillus anthracis]